MGWDWDLWAQWDGLGWIGDLWALRDGLGLRIFRHGGTGWGWDLWAQWDGLGLGSLGTVGWVGIEDLWAQWDGLGWIGDLWARWDGFGLGWIGDLWARWDGLGLRIFGHGGTGSWLHQLIFPSPDGSPMTPAAIPELGALRWKLPSLRCSRFPALVLSYFTKLPALGSTTGSTVSQ